MALVTDILLLFASGGAFLYCLVLNRRLKALQSTNNGLGAAIASLTKSVRDTKAALKETNALADEAIGRLQPLIDEARAAEADLEAVLQSQADAGERVVQATEKAGDDLMDRISPIVDKAHAVACALDDKADRLQRIIESEPEAESAPADVRPAAKPQRLERPSSPAPQARVETPEPGIAVFDDEPVFADAEKNADQTDEPATPVAAPAKRARLARLRS